MNKVVIVFFAILISGCCETEVVSFNKLTEFEEQLIPYYEEGNSYFIDENSNSVRASIQRRELTTNSYQEENCQAYQSQQLTGSIYFFPRNFAILLEMNNAFNDDASMKLTERNLETTTGQNVEVVSQYDFYIDCEQIYESNLEQKLTNIMTHQFEFDNVLMFMSCDSNSIIEKIICTPQKGVEFIEFRDSTYLKLLN